MTPRQLITNCAERGIRLSANDKGGIVADGPEVLLTPRLLDTLREYKIALLPFLPPPTEDDELFSRGREVEAHLTAKWDEAVRAAEAGEMPSCDNMHESFVPGFRPVNLCRGTNSWWPAKTLLNAVRYIEFMQGKYGDDWLKIDNERPMPERDARCELLKALAIVHWWSTYDGPKPEIKSKSGVNTGDHLDPF